MGSVSSRRRGRPAGSVGGGVGQFGFFEAIEPAMPAGGIIRPDIITFDPEPTPTEAPRGPMKATTPTMPEMQLHYLVRALVTDESIGKTPSFLLDESTMAWLTVWQGLSVMAGAVNRAEEASQEALAGAKPIWWPAVIPHPLQIGYSMLVQVVAPKGLVVWTRFLFGGPII